MITTQPPQNGVSEQPNLEQCYQIDQWMSCASMDEYLTSVVMAFFSCNTGAVLRLQFGTSQFPPALISAVA